jgi:hypothetical protein
VEGEVLEECKSSPKVTVFEWFAPTIDSQVVIGIVDKFAVVNQLFLGKAPFTFLKF